MTAPAVVDGTIAAPAAGTRRRPGLRLFASAADEPRARRASDLIVLVAATFALSAVGVVAVPAPGASRALSRYLASLPSALTGLWQAVADGLVLLALVVVAVAVARRRFPVARDLVVAAAVAVAVALVTGRLAQGSWPAVWDALRAAEPPARFPSLRLAVPGAVIVTALPHLVLPLRRLGRWALALAAVAVVALGAATPVGAAAGLLVVAIASAAVHLVFGSSDGRPSLALVAAALDELGVRTASLGVGARQQAGQFLVHATDEAGRPLVVKVYGRDAHDTALVATLWRSVWYRDVGTSVRIGRRRQVEHEAFLTLLARQNGVATDVVVTAGATTEDDAVLVLRRAGRPLDDLLDDPAAGLDPAAIVAGTWALVRRLHDGAIAHGHLDDRHLVVTGDGEVGAVDFGAATTAAGDAHRRIDEVQAFVVTLGLVGADEAVAAARHALGPDGLAALLPYLQAAVLTPHQRRRLAEADVDLDAVRARAAEATGAPPPDLQRLRRITLASVVGTLLPAVAVIALLIGLAGLDLAQLAELVDGASWWLLALGVAVTQAPRLTQAVSTLGAAPVPLPLGPVYALQLAVSYLNIAIPSSAARVAVNIRFFQRHGVPPGAALAAGAVDGFSGFIVQAVVLGGLLVATPASLDLRLDAAVDGVGRILAVVVAIAAVSVAAVLAVGPARRFLLGWARRLAAEAVTTVRGLRSLRRLALLFGGNLATEVLFAASLGLFARALGYPVGLDELLVINISVALLSGIMPVPGGIGVAEGGLTFGLAQAGLPEEVALATALLYRLASFYLPPVWGFFAMRWLERHEHL